MAEAQNGFATLKEVDKDTFVRFIEWANKGYYTAAEFTTVVEDGSDSERVAEKAVQRTDISAVEDDGQMFPDPEVLPEPATIDEYDTWSGPWGTSLKKGKKTKRAPRTAKEAIWHSFISRRPVIRKSAIEVPPPRGNKSPAEVYSDVFLSHARLYVFAEQWDIQELKMLALDELHATLAIYTLYTERTSDIINLLRYVYCNTSEPSERVENLRTLVTQYVGCEMDILADDEDFKNLMIKDGGPLLSDFLAMFKKRNTEAI